jgi:hypothetical protein
MSAMIPRNKKTAAERASEFVTGNPPIWNMVSALIEI